MLKEQQINMIKKSPQTDSDDRKSKNLNVNMYSKRPSPK